MELKVFVVGMLQSNSYLFYDSDSGEAICFDAGDEADRIVKFLNENNLNLKYLVLTHGHCDHIGAADKLRQKTGCKIIIHQADVEMIRDKNINMSETFGLGAVEFDEDIAIEDGYTMEMFGHKLIFHHTPGHTKGSICIEFGEYLLTGDTLFKQSIGRTDFYGGSMREMYFTLLKLGEMDPNFIVLPGHGESSTIREELQTNMYMIKACGNSKRR